jgi:hypothetical protein
MLIKLIEPKIDNISQSIGPDMVHGLLEESQICDLIRFWLSCLGSLNLML